MNKHFFNEAMKELSRRRDSNRSIAEQRREEIYEKLPEYKALSDKLAETGQRLVRLIIKGGDIAAELSVLEAENRATRERMNALLTGAGYPQDYLEPIYSCPLCKDKGSAGGEWCSCVKKLMLEAAARELNENSPLELSSFSTFKTDYYSEQINPELRVSERVIMQRNFEYCKKYAEEFSPKSGGIFMSGATGLGKTHLSLAVANRVLQRGFSVIYGSVPELLRIIEREYFGKADGDTISSLIDCDLLILDDLGAEMSKELYSSLLYEIINARVSRGQPMIVSTNYSAAELWEHYPDKICSRLLCMHAMPFVGSDIRQLIKN